MASAEGKRTEDFSEKSLNLENSLNLRFGFPRVKRHFSYEGNEQCLGSRLPGLLRRAGLKVTPEHIKKNLHACICVHLLTCVQAGIEVTERVHLHPK